MEHKMLTKIPGPKGTAMYERRAKAMPSCMPSLFPTVVTRAEGALIEDVDGNVLIDFCGGIGVMNIGHTNPEVVQACKDQMDKIVHPQSYTLGGYESMIDLAETLNEITPGSFEKSTAFFNSGAEAVENAIKIARGSTGRDGIVCFTNAFHGRTYLCASLTSKPGCRKNMGHFPGGIFRIDVPYEYRTPDGIPKDKWVDYYINKAKQFFLECIDLSEIAAILLEPVQGDGGFIVFPNEFVNYLRELCDKNGIVLICDEIQTGFCRTGKMFASEYWDVAPDLICVSKSLAAGMPLSAVTGRKELFDKLHKGAIGGTLGGNAVSCAAANAAIKVYTEQDFNGKAMKVAEITQKRLDALASKYKIIGDIRGRGAMQCIELVKDRTTKEPATDECAAILKEAQVNGLVVIGCGARANLIRFLMPLVITEEQINQGMDILEKAFEKYGY